jgi:trans-aconitate methyltransferase
MRFFNRKYNQNKFWSGDAGRLHYEQRNETNDETTQPQIDYLKQYLKTIEFNSVLEVACGYGRFTKMVYDNFSITKYYAIDINYHQIKNAQQFCPGNITWINSPVQTWKSNEKFDLVFGTEILLHVVPSDIQSFVDHVISFSNKHVIFMDMGITFQEKLKGNVNLQSACHYHDLKSIFSRNPNVQSVIEHKATESSSLYHIVLQENRIETE